MGARRARLGRIGDERVVAAAVGRDDPCEAARVAVALVGREEADAAQAQLPAAVDLADQGLERRGPAVTCSRLRGALVVELDEEGSGEKRCRAARQEEPTGSSPGSVEPAIRAVLTDPT